ncbi:hypothetical protein B0H17DRAFT_1184453 [Mycena rosella]|uniref:Uncharacterized protein n=1 Tax=Mycena rosella TaxID=1033263 RepID=A0AAD7CVG2_MYCRO|nr:hypothetical protein B0H17DRAFT_1184453 [Mycena rosella]
MTPAIPPGADTSSPCIPAPGISALLVVLGTVYSLHHLARRGTRFISEELEDTKKVYHDAFAREILDFQLESDRVLDREFHDVEDEASALHISFLAVSPVLLPFMQLVSLVAITQCAYNLRVLKKKIQEYQRLRAVDHRDSSVELQIVRSLIHPSEPSAGRRCSVHS